MRKDLIAGTRPEIGIHKVILTGSDGFDGYEVVEYIGMAWGITVRAKDFGQDCMMGCTNITGGELTSYSDLGNESRQQAIDRMISMAKRQKANAIINVEFEISNTSTGVPEVIVHGTAVRIEPIKNYIPSGAAGNLLHEISQKLGKAD